MLGRYDNNFSKLRNSTSDIREFIKSLKHFMDLLSGFKSPLSNCNWWRNISSISDLKRKKKHKQKTAKKQVMRINVKETLSLFTEDQGSVAFFSLISLLSSLQHWWECLIRLALPFFPTNCAAAVVQGL